MEHSVAQTIQSSTIIYNILSRVIENQRVTTISKNFWQIIGNKLRRRYLSR